MTVLQFIVNVVVAIVAVLVVNVAMSYAPAFDLKALLTFLLDVVAVVLVFTSNAAARLGVR